MYISAFIGLLILVQLDSLPPTGEQPPPRGPAARHLDHPENWYSSNEARRIAANVLSYQSEVGGWPKNTDTTRQPYTGDRDQLAPSFDNRATVDELRLLAHIYKATSDEQYRVAFLKGFDYILKAQYPNGGWPQFYPPNPRVGYQRYITFNDGTMVRLMEFLREVYSKGIYDFVAAQRRSAARNAFDRGINCILQCQIKVNGKLTVWCAQHDDKDFRPRPARTYELASLSGSESVGIVELLMSLENPSPEVIRAVDGAAAWFESAKIKGIRIERRNHPDLPQGKRDRVVVEDPAAPPMWARFYEIETNKPLFVDRDGIPKSQLSEIGVERRSGYVWLGYWPRELLEKQYPAWKRKRETAQK